MRPSHFRGAPWPAQLLFLTVLYALPPASFGGESVWVRVHSSVDHPDLVSTRVETPLADYGRFQWGQLPSRDVAKLQQAGIRLTVIDNPFALTLGGETFDLIDHDAADPTFQLQPDDSSPGFHLIQFNGPVRSQWLRSLRARGIEVVQPVHPFSYFVWAGDAQVGKARGLANVRATAPVLPQWKVQPRLRDLGAEMRPTMALISRHDLRNTLEAMRRAGAEIHSNTRLSAHFEVIHLDVAGNRYMALGEIPGVYTVQHINQDAGPRGEMSNQSVVGGIDGNTIVPGYPDWLIPTGYDGSGVIVGIVDGGVQENHPDLIDNIAPCLGTEGSCTGASDSHGTHVAGAVAGTGLSGVTDSAGFLRSQGVAPGADLVNQAYGPFLGAGPGGMVPEGMLRLFKDSADSGTLLTNNSWGPTGNPQGYDIPTMQVDLISRDALPDTPGHTPVLAVWSIMNGNGDSGGNCAPSSLGSPDEAKNLFSVGSTGLQAGSGAQLPIDEVFSVSSNSAHGPACDGRRVPDIVAPGCHTDSASTSSSYGLSCGTSMASPVVSGAIALWAERYITETGTIPSPALMKAVFIAAAENLAGGTDADGGTLDHRPDRFQGFGRLDLDEVMNPAGDFVYLMDQDVVFTEAGQDWGIGLNAADPNEPMRIMLTWTDAPGHGQGGTTPAWVNILDLEVDALDGNTYLGNVIGPDGWSESGGSADHMNNTEGVWLRPDQHQGGIDLRVLATDIAGDALNPHDPGDPSQDFAIACYNCIVGDPTFRTSLAPTTIEACISDSGSEDYLIEVSINGIGQYDGTVVLSSVGEPAGVSSLFDPVSVKAPGRTDWILTIGNSASAGTSTLILTGDDGEETHERELSLVLDELLASKPGLLNPQDGASDLSLTPQFSWEVLSDVATYRLQVATDDEFNNLLIDELIQGGTFTPAVEFDTGTSYFWRVQGVNLCGGGAYSDTFTFSTRLEPEASFSTTEFSFFMPGDSSDAADLQISNIGTGNLHWSNVTDNINSGHGTGRFDGDFDIENWDLVNDPAGVGGSFFTDVGPPLELFVVGGDDDTGGVTDLQIVIPTDGVIHFDWGYQTNDTACWDSGGYAINDAYVELACNDAEVPYFEGSESVEVGEGDLFAFRVATDDGLLGEGTLGVTNFQFEAAVCGEELTNVDWLSVSPDNGVIGEGGSETVSVMIDSTGLVDGDYLGYLCVTTNDPGAELVPMPVKLAVDSNERPEIDINPQPLSAVLALNGKDTQKLTISNRGKAALSWEIPVSGDDPACELPRWLEADPLSGTLARGASEKVSVTFDATGLEHGDYSTTLCLASDNDQQQPIEVAIKLSVVDPIIFEDRFEDAEG